MSVQCWCAAQRVAQRPWPPRCAWQRCDCSCRFKCCPQSTKEYSTRYSTTAGCPQLLTVSIRACPRPAIDVLPRSAASTPARPRRPGRPSPTPPTPWHRLQDKLPVSWQFPKQGYLGLMKFLVEIANLASEGNKIVSGVRQKPTAQNIFCKCQYKNPIFVKLFPVLAPASTPGE